MRTILRSRRALAACAVPVLLLGVTACSGDETRPVAGQASSSPSAAGELSSEGESSPADEGTSEGADGEGVSDPEVSGGSWDEETLVPAMMAAMAEQKSAHFTMDMSGGGMAMDAEGDLVYRGKTQDMVMVMDGSSFGAGTIEMRMVDRVLYLSMPPMTPKGKFVEIRPDDPGSPFAGMMGQMGVDPRESIEAFESGLRRLTYVGEESVGGEDLEHYRLKVDFRAAAKAQGLPRTAGMPKTLDYDMWLDEDALMRRMEMDVAPVSMVMEMSDWGEPVRVTAPPRKDIVEAPNGMSG